jgi:hypothetical protein
MWKKCTFLLILLVLISSSAIAQKKSRGVSLPGSIGYKTEEAVAELSGTDMVCRVSFSEPSHDNMLSSGEMGTISIEVENRNLKISIEPELEISIHSSWNPKPKISKKWMDRIDPGEKGVYTSKVKWDKRLPSGVVIYKVKAIDNISGLQSDQVEISFDIQGEGKETKAPIFVDVDKSIPKVAIQNNYGIAVIIGNKNYSNPDVPDVEYALNDANTIKRYLINMLGFREDNIIFIENAKKADFERVFGTKDVYEGKLYNWIKPNQSDVFIYYSGHGAPDVRSKKAYFMPANCDPNYVRIDAYPLDVFYNNLEKIPAKSIVVVLDACFSGGSQQGMLIKDASPMYIDVQMPLLRNRFNLFTSAEGDQIASWYPDGKHSLFTYYFLRAIRGEADKDRNREINLKEIKNFIEENVTYMARRIYGREQTPVVRGELDFIVSTY